MTIPSQLLNQVKALLEKSSHPLLISHPRPDGDTIGSTLALYLALVHLGKQPTVACAHTIPQSLAYLSGADDYVQDVPEDADIDLVVAIDMSDLERPGGIYKDAWKEEDVSVDASDALSVFQHPTLRMQKYFCTQCGDVLFNTNGMSWRVVSQLLIARSNDGNLPEELSSLRHFFYEQRVVDVDDDLPKYMRGTDGPLFGE